MKAFGWFRRLEWFGRTMVVAGLLVLAGSLFYAVENQRGKRAWESCQRELTAKGVELDFQKLAPAPVPDDQNFAMTPFLAPLFDFRPRPWLQGQSPWRDKEGQVRACGFANELQPTNGDPELVPIPLLIGHRTDLQHAFQLLETNSSTVFPSRVEAGSAVLVALERYRPVLDELQSASRRPYARFNISYGDEDPAGIYLPHLAVLLRISRAIEVRASAELAVGKTDAAFNDTGFIFFLARTLQQEPFIVSRTVRARLLLIAEQIIWEGLGERQWSETQLQEFEDHLTKTTLVSELEETIKAERAAFGVKGFEFIRRHPHGLRQIASYQPEDVSAPFGLLTAAPSGWLYQEQVAYQRLFDEKVLTCFGPGAGQIQSHVVDTNEQVIDSECHYGALKAVWRHRVLSALMLNGIHHSFQKTAAAQSSVNFGAIACALERHRLARGNFPETLEALAPEFIARCPLDVCNGQPLKYHRTDDRRFVLYSIGWDEKDDGGLIKTDRSGKIIVTGGDWVWPQYETQSASLTQTTN